MADSRNYLVKWGTGSTLFEPRLFRHIYSKISKTNRIEIHITYYHFHLAGLISLRLFSRIFSFPIAILLLTISLSLTQNENAIQSEGRLQKTIVRGSEYSFSLYLTHFPLIALATSLFVPVDRWQMSPFGIFVLILLTLGALVTAYGFAWLTEFNLAQVRIALRSRVQKLIPE